MPIRLTAYRQAALRKYYKTLTRLLELPDLPEILAQHFAVILLEGNLPKEAASALAAYRDPKVKAFFQKYWSYRIRDSIYCFVVFVHEETASKDLRTAHDLVAMYPPTIQAQ